MRGERGRGVGEMESERGDAGRERGRRGRGRGGM